MNAFITSELQQMRIDLAAAFRWAARHGFHEGVCNHFSLAVDDTGERFLINPYRFHFSEIRASDLLLIDIEGHVIEPEGAPAPEPTAYFIHAWLHRKVPQARCILHTHMPYATALTSIENGGLEPCNQVGLRFVDRIAYDDDYGGVALDDAEGERIAGAMGNRDVMFMAHHGVTVIGNNVGEAFDRLYYLERACQNQVLAMSTGRPLRTVSPEQARHAAQQIAGEEAASAEAHFSALKRILDREAPDYRH